RDSLGVENAVYHVVGGTGREYGAFTYSSDWVDHYKAEEFYRHDPVVNEAIRRFHPLDWKTLDWGPKKARQILTEAIDGGIGKQGLSIPVRGVGGQFAMFSVTGFESDAAWDKFIDEKCRDVLLSAHYIHDRVAQLMDGENTILAKPLSPRERDALAMLAAGKSRAEAADRLKISEHTFRVYVDTARHKLGAMNTVHAVAKAVSSGLILP
ncbi:MAG: LuxR family transcriptional regulator, partial [Pseudomonadota bacterium]